MIKWLIGLIVTPLIEALKPAIKDIVKTAVDEANAKLLQDIEAIPSAILTGMTGLLQSAVKHPFKAFGL